MCISAVNNFVDTFISNEDTEGSKSNIPCCAAGARNICVTYAPDSRRIHAGCARHIRESDANIGRTCRATRDVTFGPLCHIGPLMSYCLSF
jgi:hypothetical protein